MTMSKSLGCNPLGLPHVPFGPDSWSWGFRSALGVIPMTDFGANRCRTLSGIVTYPGWSGISPGRSVGCTCMRGEGGIRPNLT